MTMETTEVMKPTNEEELKLTKEMEEELSNGKGEEND